MFRFVSLPQEETIAPELITKAGEDFSTILDDITKIFDPITESPVSVILGPNSAGGLEGMNAFSILNPWEEDSIGWFNMIIAHEMIHCWIGIRVGDYEDPWWKEGTTSYLGYLIALRNDLCSDYFIRRKLLLDLSDNIGVNKFALSDPEVRSKIYAPGDDNCESLVYNKGAQVNMLIDRRIREISNGTATLPKILGNFVREFEGRPFYRSEYILFINEQSGADVSDIFKKYVETTGAIPGSVLTENCSALAEMKAFGDYMMPLQKRLITKSYTPEKLYAF